MSTVTKTDVKLFLGIPSGTTTDDTLLDRIIACAEADALSQVDRNISTISTYTEDFDGDGESGRLVLKETPVTAVLAVYDDLDRAFSADTLLDAADYTFTANGILKLDSSLKFTKGTGNVRVQYQAGYAAVPEDFKKAIIDMSIAEYMRVKTRINAVADDEIGGKISALEKRAKEVLARYRNTPYGD